MKIALLSDLHLSTPDDACAFGPDPAPLLRLLDHMERTHDAIALVGDVFDHKIGPGFPHQRRDLEAARRHWPQLVQRLRAPHVHWIWGNNDALLAREGIPEQWTLDADGARLVLLHGHQFAPLHQAFEALKYPIKALASWDLRSNGGRAGRVLYRINDALTQPAEGSPRPSAAQRGAVALLQARPDVDIVVCGHDHRPQVTRTPWGIYANSGSCAYGRMDWLSVDMARRQVTALRWER